MNKMYYRNMSIFLTIFIANTAIVAPYGICNTHDWNEFRKQVQNQIPNDLENLREKMVLIHEIDKNTAKYEINQLSEQIYQQEFINIQDDLVTSYSGTSESRMFQGMTSNSIVPQPRFNNEPHGGPFSELNLARGTLELSSTDIELPMRNGLGFVFTRYYRSSNTYDGPLGVGWDHNHNDRLYANNYVISKATKIDWYNGFSRVSFARIDKNWEPQDGSFYKLETFPHKIVIRTRDAQRIEFERAVTQSEKGSFWRVLSRTTLHIENNIWTNQILYRYIPGQDLLNVVLDPYGNEITFEYDKLGHLRLLRFRNLAVIFDYENSQLLKVKIPGIAISTSETCTLKHSYSYSLSPLGSIPLLTRYTPPGERSYIQYEFSKDSMDGIPRVISVKQYKSSNQEILAEWGIKYEKDQNGEKCVCYTPPKPSPVVELCFSNKLSAHSKWALLLPTKRVVPAQKATWSYRYNDQGLIIESLSPIGNKTTWEFDDKNENPLMRENLKAVRFLPKEGPTEFPIKEYGEECDFHHTLPLPTRILRYEIDRNGQKIIIETQTYNYNDAGDILSESLGDIEINYMLNKYGLIAARINTQGCIDVYQYYCDMHEGEYSMGCGGLLAELVRDISPDKAQLLTLQSSLSLPKVKSRTVSRFPENLKTMYEYSDLGYLNKESSSFRTITIITNKLGYNIALYDTNSDLELWRYDKSLNKIRWAIRTAFPQDDALYQGEEIPGVRGRFYIETYEHDSRGLLISWLKTKQKFNGQEVRVTYEYYPNGQMCRRKVSDSPDLVRLFNQNSGYLVKEYLEANGQHLVLRDGFKYNKEGFCTEYVDEKRRVITFSHDPFGRPYSMQNSTGIQWISRLDGANRLVSESVINVDGKILDERTQSFNQSGLPILVRRHRLSWDNNGNPEIDEWIIETEHKYNNAGQLIAKRSERNDSWVHIEYDGLGRRSCLNSAEGDSETYFYEGEKIGITISSSHDSHDGKITEQSFIILYDERRNPSFLIPCSEEKKPLFKRSTIYKYDPRGRLIFSADPGRSLSQTSYDSLDNQTRIALISEESNETSRIKTFEYDSAGRLTREILQNNALAFLHIGDSPVLNVKRIDSPQVNELHYDQFGRLEKEIQPDGLEISRSYGNDSMLNKLKQYRNSESQILTFKYDALKRLASIHSENNLLQEFEYDNLNHLIKGSDYLSKEGPVVLLRRFDSVGNLLEENLSIKDQILPGGHKLSYDFAEGIISKSVLGINDISNSLWKSIVWNTDRDGRVVSMKLDEVENYCEFGYRKNLPIYQHLTIPQIVKKILFSPDGDPIQYSWFDQNSHLSPFLNIQYFYDNYGRVEASDTELPSKSIQFTNLFQYNSFSELVSDGLIQRLFRTREERMNALYDEGNFNFSTAISRFKYDQAGNRIREYKGNIKDNEQTFLRYFSSAEPFNGNTLERCLTTAQKSKELCSNRLVSTARYIKMLNNQDLPFAEMGKSYSYDFLGRLNSYSGYFEGKVINWEVQYDSLGRVIQMNGINTDTETECIRLEFASDILNRRVLKKVINRCNNENKTKLDYTTYDNNNPLLTFQFLDKRKPIITGEYLWGPNINEIIMVVLPNSISDIGSTDNSNFKRHFLFQDRTQSVILSAIHDQGQLELIDHVNYMGFGENATIARVSSVECTSIPEYDSNFNDCIDNLLDGKASRWLGNPGSNALALRLEKNVDLESLSIWADKFPSDYNVFVLPENLSARDIDFYKSQSFQDIATRNGYLALSVSDHTYSYGQFKRKKNPNSVEDSYELPLKGLNGKTIVITWVSDQPQSLSVREFQLKIIPHPPSNLAFSGVWLDQETGLYYHNARYRLPNMGGKFISPDPLGFAAGNNLYAYANNNPLVFNDPEGQYAHVIMGAGVGAVLGGGGYALQVWLTGTEWNWTKFGVYTAAGATSGALSALTFGASMAYTAQIGLSSTKSAVIASSMSGAVGGLSHGGISGSGITYIETGDISYSLKMGGIASVQQGGLGLIGGGVGGGVLSKLGGSFWGALGSGISGGAAAGSISGSIKGYQETGTFLGTLEGLSYGAIEGAITGGVIAAGGWGVGRLSGLIRPLPKQPEGLPDPRSEGLLVRTNPKRGDYGRRRIEPGKARHHKKPLSLGGTDTPDNIINVDNSIHRQPHPGSEVNQSPYGTIYY